MGTLPASSWTSEEDEDEDDAISELFGEAADYFESLADEVEDKQVDEETLDRANVLPGRSTR
jgi:hypothetical protein